MNTHFPGQRYNIAVGASAPRREQRVVGDGRHAGLSARGLRARCRAARQVRVQDSPYAQCGRSCQWVVSTCFFKYKCIISSLCFEFKT